MILMEILSISIDKEALEQLEQVQKRLGFKSRSKMLRNAVLSMLHDYEVLEALTGQVESIFIITYSEKERNNVSNVLHRYEDEVVTELHHHHPGTCIDVLIVHANAKKTRDIFGVLKRNKCIYSVNYSVIHATPHKSA